jgi:hypothetical protein
MQKVRKIHSWLNFDLKLWSSDCGIDAVRTAKLIPHKTNSQNLEKRFDAGEDVLDYFDARGVLKARPSSGAEQVASASDWPEGFFESVRVSRESFGRAPDVHTEKEL